MSYVQNDGAYCQTCQTSIDIMSPNPLIKNKREKKSDGFCIKKACIHLTSIFSCILWYVSLCILLINRTLGMLPFLQEGVTTICEPILILTLLFYCSQRPEILFTLSILGSVLIG